MAGMGDLLQAPFNPIQGPQTGAAPTIDQSQFQQYMNQYGGQGGAMSLLQQAAMGQAPSVAQMQLQQGMNQAQQQAGAQAASTRGNMGLGMAAKQAQATQAGLASQSAAQSAQLRAQEMAQARGQFAQGALAGAQTAIQPQEQQAALQEQQNQLNEKAQEAQMQAQAANQKQGSSLISGIGNAVGSVAGLAAFSDENAKSDMDGGAYAMGGGQLLSPSDAEDAYARGNVDASPMALSQTRSFMGDAPTAGPKGPGMAGVFRALGGIAGGGSGNSGPIKDLYGGTDTGSSGMFSSFIPVPSGGTGSAMGALSDAGGAGAAVSDENAKQEAYRSGLADGVTHVMSRRELTHAKEISAGPLFFRRDERGQMAAFSPDVAASRDEAPGHVIVRPFAASYRAPSVQDLSAEADKDKVVHMASEEWRPAAHDVHAAPPSHGGGVVVASGPPPAPPPPVAVMIPRGSGGDSGQYATSDDRAKSPENRGDQAAMQFLSTLQPHAFTWKDPSVAPNPKAAAGPNLGVFAQEVEQSPWGKSIVQRDPGTGYKTLDMHALMGALAAGVGYERKQQKDHEDRIADLERAVHGGR